ncbi:MAG: hypothetical protein RL154_614 [Pseudomonadota bacterium]|jgi:CheY-like chemotaxis protein
MIRVLIIDDDKSARISLKYALHGLEDVQISEAEDEIEAVAHIEKDMFDAIFIDLDAKTLENFETIRRISAIDKKALIVCISEDCSPETVRRASKNGAGSFIEKPLKANVLKLRFQAYKKLLEHNSIVGFEAGSVSLFKEPVFDYSTTFKITSENSIARFWEYFADYECPEIDKCVRVIFEIGTALLIENRRFIIFVETSEFNKYFTVYVPGLVGRLNVADELVQSGLPYAVTENKFSLKCGCKSEQIEAKTVPVIKKPSEQIIQIATMTTQKVDFKIYDFIDKDDLVELCDNIADLESTLAILQYSNLNPDEVLVVADYFVKMSRLIIGYPETFAIAEALSSLGDIIQTNVEAFRDKSKLLSSIFITFCSNLTDWRKALFFDGAPSVDFMDATIIADAQTISNIIVPQQNSTPEDMDDIFNF